MVLIYVEPDADMKYASRLYNSIPALVSAICTKKDFLNHKDRDQVYVTYNRLYVLSGNSNSLSFFKRNSIFIKTILL